jgi:hypothetical protein
VCDYVDVVHVGGGGRVCSGACAFRNGVGESGASGVIGIGSVVVLRTTGLVVRLMLRCWSLGGTVVGLIQHSVLVVLSWRPSSLKLVVMVSSAFLMLE